MQYRMCKTKSNALILQQCLVCSLWAAAGTEVGSYVTSTGVL